MKRFFSILIFTLLFTSKSLAADFFWIGGPGHWSDFSHWSSMSGGPANQVSAPADSDNVFIDINSGLGAYDTIRFDLTDEFVHNFTVDSFPYPIVFHIDTSITYSSLHITGDIYIPSTTIWYSLPNTYVGLWFSPSDTVFSVYIPNSDLAFADITGPAEMNLTSRLSIISDFNIGSGDVLIKTNNYDFSTRSLSNMGPGNHLAELGTSNFFVVTYIDIPVDADSANIIYHDYSPGGVYSPITVKKLTIESGSDIVFYSPLKAEEAVISGFATFQSGIEDTINSLRVYNTLTADNLVCDSLVLSNPYNYFNFANLTVNNYVETNSLPGDQILFHGVAAGSTFVANFDTVCMDFLHLENVAAIGPAIYYGGAFTDDAGGNTGWIFSSCSPQVSNVWPGDVNNDLVVDNLDMLLIGNGTQASGTLRDSISTLYIAHSAIDWNGSYANGINLKYGDCNGDGTILMDDTLAIVQNYGLTHPAFNGSLHLFPLSGFGSELTLDLPSTLTPGTSYSIPVVYGDSLSTNNPLYGIAFSILYDSTVIDPGSISFDFPSSWLANIGESVNFWKNESNLQKVAVAITRFDHINAQGQGNIATFNFTTKPSAANTLNFQFIRALALLENQSQIILDLQPQSIVVTTGLSDTEFSTNDWHPYPNPVHDALHIRIYGKSEQIRISIENELGQTVIAAKEYSSSNEIILNTALLPSGIYFIKIQSGHQITYKRFVK
ncbi:MAG: T9SS type A sorting domain-containing protein [Bacteroidia bacterium]